MKCFTQVSKMLHCVALILPWAFYVAYRPGEMILLLKSPYEYSGEWGTHMNRALGDNPALSVLGLAIVSLGYGWFYGAARILSPKMILVCSVTAITLLSTPVIAYRSSQVFADWLPNAQLKIPELRGFDYVKVQNACQIMCGLLLIILSIVGSRQVGSTRVTPTD